jgi:hypothetical protein
VRHLRVLAAGCSAVLVLGFASPALAKHADKPPKAPKPATVKVNGGGTTQAGAHFSVNAKQDRRSKVHFDYDSADHGFRVHCRRFDSVNQVVYIQAGPPAVHVTATCELREPHHPRTSVNLDGTFIDNGEPGTKDVANLSFTRGDGSTLLSDNGTLRKGGIKVS